MKSQRFSLIRLLSLALGVLLMNAWAAPLLAGELKLEAILVWGTNDEKSPDPNHKPVGERLEKKLKKLPFKWAHYFEVSRKKFSLAEGQVEKVELSKECRIEVRSVGKEAVEVQLFGKGKLVSKISQAMTKDECLVTGGNAPDVTAWFVVLRQAE